ncbi:hypothetical protein ACW9YV_27930 (plasmid) [Paraburkholderia strydomiana]
MTTMNTGAASLSDETILAIEKKVAYRAKSRDDLTIKTVRACIDAAIAAGGAQETAAARDVLAERQRQVTAERWTPAHDDKHSGGDLAQAAGCYAFHACGVYAGMYPVLWPWQQSWWKPTTPRRDLLKAGALILAEIERIDRGSATSAANGEAT